MTGNSIRVRPIGSMTLVVTILSGCASHYLIGYNYTDEQGVILNNVSNKQDADFQQIEEEFVRAVISYDLNPVRPRFAPRLSAQMPAETIAAANSSLKRRFRFDGVWERTRIGDQMPKGLPMPGDNFDHYDFLASQVMLSGDPGAGIRLFVAKLDGKHKICGFYVLPLPDDPSQYREPLGHLLSETIDKAGAFRKPEFGDRNYPVKE